MSTPPAPTIVLVHGAFADASGWSAVHGELRRGGLSVIAPPNPLRGLERDAAYLTSIVADLDGPVVLVGHSYGGAVISVAGIDEQVVALVFVAAYAPDAGESLAHVQGRFADPELAAHLHLVALPAGEGGRDVSISAEAFPSVFAADVPDDVAAFLAVSQRPLAAAAFDEPARAAAWRTTPSWGLVPTADATINPEVHRFSYARAGMTTVEVPGASHAVHLSHPAAVADLVRRAVEATC